MSFKEIALPLAARGIRVVPVEPRAKRCTLAGWPEKATTSTQQILAWDEELPDANVGCVAHLDNYAILDCDQPGLAERIERETGQRFPMTLLVRSAGRGCPHYYFLHTARSRTLGNRATGDFDLKAHHSYVVGPGSLLATPTGERVYEVVDDSPAAEFPDWLVDWIEAHSQNATKRVHASGARRVHDNFDLDDLLQHYGLEYEVAGDWYVTHICPVAGRKHEQSQRTGFYFDGQNFGFHCFAAGCPGSSMTVGQVLAHLADRARKAPLSAMLEPYQGVIWPSPITEAVRDSRIEDEQPEPEPLPLPPYPVRVWDDTLYGEYARLCTRGNYIPAEYFIESIKTVTGAVLGESLSLLNVAGGMPRFYTLLIGPPSNGKNISIGWATHMFRHLREGEPALTDMESGEPPDKLLWHPQDDFGGGGLGACLTKIGSASGLARFLPSAAGKKKAVPQERILLCYPEIAELLEKIGIDGSGRALVSALCDLFDDTEFSVQALAEQMPFGGKLLMSILAGIQPELWMSIGSGKGVEYSGLHSRWTLIPAGPTKQVYPLVKPDLTPFYEVLRARLPRSPLEMTLTPRASNLMRQWIANLQKESADGVDLTTRLGIFVQRNALHHAWLRGGAEVDDEDIQAGIALSDYQLQVRKLFSPVVGDNVFAKAENRIRQALSQGPLSMRELRRRVNYQRMGVHMFNKAMVNLSQDGSILISDLDSQRKEVSLAG